jgi:hypothetical protein
MNINAANEAISLQHMQNMPNMRHVNPYQQQQLLLPQQQQQQPKNLIEGIHADKKRNLEFHENQHQINPQNMELSPANSLINFIRRVFYYVFNLNKKLW